MEKPLKLVAINKELSKKYGFPESMDYDRPDFYGHQVGVAIALKNDETGEIEKNFMPGDNKEKNLAMLLSEDIDRVIENPISQFNRDENKLVAKTWYLMPYAVEGHPKLKPTVVVPISGCYNVRYELEMEVVFAAEEDICRYIAAPFVTRNTCYIDLLHDIFDYNDESETFEFFKNTPDFHYDEDEYSYSFRLYNEAGDAFEHTFDDIDDLKRAIISMRILSCNCIITG